MELKGEDGQGIPMMKKTVMIGKEDEYKAGEGSLSR